MIAWLQAFLGFLSDRNPVKYLDSSKKGDGCMLYVAVGATKESLATGDKLLNPRIKFVRKIGSFEELINDKIRQRLTKAR